MRKMPGQPDSAPSSCLSQSSVLAERLFTTRTTQTPPARASTLNSVASGGEPGTQPSASLANSRGGSQAVTTERDSMPGPKVNVTATGFPPCSSNSAGTNQAEIPCAVAMACHTSSGVPGTSTSTWMERRPEASFFTLMLLAPDALLFDGFLHIPDQNPLVGRGHQPPAIGSEREDDPTKRPSVFLTQVFLMVFQLLNLFACGHVPKINHAVRTAACQRLAVHRKRDVSKN